MCFEVGKSHQGLWKAEGWRNDWTAHELKRGSSFLPCGRVKMLLSQLSRSTNKCARVAGNFHNFSESGLF